MPFSLIPSIIILVFSSNSSSEDNSTISSELSLWALTGIKLSIFSSLVCKILPWVFEYCVILKLMLSFFFIEKFIIVNIFSFLLIIWAEEEK